jgi:hypothetical protein
MITLTGIFKVYARFGNIVELIKNDIVVPFSRNDIKVVNGKIMVSEKAFKEHKKFFRTFNGY